MSSLPVDNGGQIVSRTPRWMWILLVLSLACNVLVLGVVFGSMWAVRKGGLWDMPVALERSQRFMSALPSERRDEIKGIFFDHKPALAPHWRDVRQARLDIGRLIEKGSYTGEELDAALNALFLKEEEARQAAKPMISAMLAQLNPRERVHFLSVFIPYLDEAQGQPAAQLKLELDEAAGAAAAGAVPAPR